MIGKSVVLYVESRDEVITVMKLLMPRFQEKPLSFRLQRTVPETNTGGQVENTKALERTRVKELGIIVS